MKTILVVVAIWLAFHYGVAQDVLRVVASVAGWLASL